MIHVKCIDWQPIANIPDDRKDGRELLFWNENGPAIAAWMMHADWWEGDRPLLPSPTYWADINPPE